MNESLLGCLVWTVFAAVFLGLDHVLWLVLPASRAWAPFPALLLLALVWFGALFASMARANREGK